MEEYRETLQEWKKWAEPILEPRKRQCAAQPTLATYISSISRNEELPKTSIINLVTSSDNPGTGEEPRATTVEKPKRPRVNQANKEKAATEMNNEQIEPFQVELKWNDKAPTIGDVQEDDPHYDDSSLNW